MNGTACYSSPAKTVMLANQPCSKCFPEDIEGQNLATNDMEKMKEDRSHKRRGTVRRFVFHRRRRAHGPAYMNPISMFLVRMFLV